MPSKSSKWLSDNFDAVSKQYPGEWVAADEKGVVLHNLDAKAVYDALPGVAKTAGKSESHYCIMRMSAPGAIYQ